MRTLLIVIIIVIGINTLHTGTKLSARGTDDDSVESVVTEILEVEEFDSIVINKNIWDIRIEKDSLPFIEITYPESSRDKFNYQFIDSEFHLSGPRKIKGFQNFKVELSGYWKTNKSLKYNLLIKTPSLKNIDINGLGKIHLHGFNESFLNISVDGVVSMSAEDSSVKELIVNINGTGKIDFRGLSAINSRVDLSGTGDLFLNMNGGVLSGESNGTGSIFYTGTVKGVRISVKGVGSVEYIE